ncbi:hypothetical protein [Neptunomonas antarctica]|uniref:J domain-containing protein n=1 Tax=Neptunomonas antarctica TaxID=619304 RepID=A0A1N7MVX3_9GAMM|nr:hypothetical protein [Neptunomonas antarctica]SIS90273.1 hypothetical protein SAMN05421760_10763 [Neptunomonas antarctica]
MRTTVTPILKKKPKKLSRQEKKFQHTWRKISLLKAENTTLAAQLDDLIRLTDEKVAPIEHSLSLEYHELIDKKLRFLTMKSLNQWQRFELAEWIEQSFDTLQLFSQADLLRFQQQVKRYNEIINPADEFDSDDVTNHAEQLESGRTQEASPDAALQQMLDAFIAKQTQQLQSFEQQQQASGQIDFIADDALEQFTCQQTDELIAFKQLLDKMRDQAEDATPFSSEHVDDSRFDQDDAQEPYTPANQARLKTLFRDASLKDIFRQLARVLHPDREQDPERARHKQVLMSDALKARDEGDILTLFAMYSEHVSQDSLCFNESELEALNQLLIHQVTQLQDEKHQIIGQSPAHRKAFECFYDTNNKKINSKITHYIQEIEAEKTLIQELTVCLSSLKSLKPFLEERRESSPNNFYQDFNEFF